MNANHLRYTEDLTNPVWVNTVVTVTPDQDTGQVFPAGTGGTLADLCVFGGSGRALRQESDIPAASLLDSAASTAMLADLTAWTRIAAEARTEDGAFYILSVYLLNSGSTSGKLTLSISIYDGVLRSNLVADSALSAYVRGFMLEQVPSDYVAG